MLATSTIARILLGVIYFVFGLNGFLRFLTLPEMPEAATQFLGALVASSYFFPVLKITEILGGLALASGQYSKLALVVLAPITIQIFLFHSFLTPGIGNLILPVFMILCHLLAAWGYWDSFKTVVSRK